MIREIRCAFQIVLGALSNMINNVMWDNNSLEMKGNYYII